jgi:hypothetical protein
MDAGGAGDLVRPAGLAGRGRVNGPERFGEVRIRSSLAGIMRWLESCGGKQFALDLAVTHAALPRRNYGWSKRFTCRITLHRSAALE